MFYSELFTSSNWELCVFFPQLLNESAVESAVGALRQFPSYLPASGHFLHLVITMGIKWRGHWTHSRNMSTSGPHSRKPDGTAQKSPQNPPKDDPPLVQGQ